jgi:hypothetical protein
VLGLNTLTFTLTVSPTNTTALGRIWHSISSIVGGQWPMTAGMLGGCGAAGRETGVARNCLDLFVFVSVC